MLVRIGRDYDKSDTSVFDGNVDDLALFAAALSADEVKRDYVVGGGQGLTPVHFSAQPEPFLGQQHALNTPVNSLTLVKPR